MARPPVFPAEEKVRIGGPSTREQQLEAEVTELTQALGEAAVELRVWKKSAEGRLGPSRTSR
jgi:transposase